MNRTHCRIAGLTLLLGWPVLAAAQAVPAAPPGATTPVTVAEPASIGAVPPAATAPPASPAAAASAPAPAAAPSAPAAPVRIGAVADRYAAGSVTTVERATQALAEAKLERLAIEARHVDDEHACRPKFFTTACLDKASERRRAALARLRPVEIEAGRTQRLIAAQQRDAAIAERLRQEAAEAPQRKANEAEYLSKQAARQAKPVPVTDPQAAARSEADFARRQAEHAARLETLAREDAVKQRAAAANIAAFEQKQRDILAHQKELAAKKADKQARAARDDAAREQAARDAARAAEAPQ